MAKIELIRKIQPIKHMSLESIPRQNTKVVVDGVYIICDGVSTLRELKAKSCEPIKVTMPKEVVNVYKELDPREKLLGHKMDELKEMADGLEIDYAGVKAKKVLVDLIIEKDS
jgi:hypothetical protein